MSSFPLDTLSDGHVHTKLCQHASGEMEEYVLSAINCGLREIIFLEHMEEGIVSPITTWLSEEDFDIYFAEGYRLQEKYRDTIEVKLGVELGYNAEHRQRLLERIHARSWDKISISYHFYPVAGEPHINLLSRSPQNSIRVRQRSPHKIAIAYLEGLIDAVEFFPGHTLSHLDAALRHVSEVNFAKHHLPLVTRLLEAVKKKGMSLELNTSGYEYQADCFPEKAIIHLAKDMDIPFVAGSDAHNPQDVGRHFQRVTKTLQEA